MSLQKKAYGRLLLCLWLTMLLAYLLQHSLAGGTFLAHNVYDSYALQAENWLAGRTWLAGGEQYTWLELASFEGRWYVSFPPVPSVLLVPWVALLGSAQAVPSNLIIAGYALAAAAGVFALAARRGAAPERCLFWAALTCMGSNLWWLSCSGGVWFQAQVLNLCFVVWGLYFACGKTRGEAAAAGFLLALAVGCRPFSLLLLAGWLAWLALRRCIAVSTGAAHAPARHSAAAERRPARAKPAAAHRIRFSLCAPAADFWCAAAPAAAVGAALGWYNFIRFGSVFEFGHNYLPEFTAAANGQFSSVYLWENLAGLLRPVTLDARLDLVFPLFNGFLPFAANPLFLVWAVHLALRARRGGLTARDAVLSGGCALALAALCVHKTFGGWQFGARYTVDLFPYLLLMELPPAPQTDAEDGQRAFFAAPAVWEWAVCVWAVQFNVYGAVYMLTHH